MLAATTPLIEPEDKNPDEKIILSLKPEMARELRAYAQYANNSSPKHIVSSALKRLFAADKGFKVFKDANPSAGIVNGSNGSSRRGRRPKVKSAVSEA